MELWRWISLVVGRQMQNSDGHDESKAGDDLIVGVSIRFTAVDMN